MDGRIDAKTMEDLAMTSPVRRESPWPGPRPYAIEDGKVFFGRKREIREIRRRVLSERLTILSGSSGVGKTSLIRAGIMWDLLKARERSEQEEGHPQVWPILLLCEWGGALNVTVEELFRTRLRQAITTLEKWAPDDYALLLPALSAQTEDRDNFFDDIVHLCDLAGGVTLILDQFEEVLRAGGEFASEAVKIVETLFRFERRARLLVSLRSEYHKELHGLETYVGGLYGRTHFLEPIVAKTVREAILLSAQSVNVKIDESVAETIIQWLQQSGIRTPQEKAEVPMPGEQRGAEPIVDLLTLQAILLELFEFCSSQSDATTLRIDQTALKAYTRRGRSEAELSGRSESELVNELVGEALERWINKALLEPAVPSEKPIPEIYELPEAKLAGFVRRIATCMAPYLSSGGYKVAAEQLDLMYGALHRDLARLCPDINDIPRGLWKVEMQGNLPRLNRQALGLAEEYNEITKFNLSGLAREKEWSPAKTAEQLVAVYFEAQRRLQNNNILKLIRVRNDVIWELSHDKLGQPLSQLAGEQQGTWDDAVYSLTVTRGSDIHLLKKEQPDRNINHVCWQGCWVYLQEGAVLDGFVFTDSNLQGTAFFECTFRGGHFNRCLMDGVLFINCQFEQGADGQPLTFSNCEANGMAFLANDRAGAKSVVDGMYLEACKFSQVKMSRLQLNGSVTVGADTSLYLCDLANFEAGDTGSSDGKVVFQAGSRVEFCAWDKASQRFITIEGGCDLISSGLRHEIR